MTFAYTFEFIFYYICTKANKQREKKDMCIERSIQTIIYKYKKDNNTCVVLNFEEEEEEEGTKKNTKRVQHHIFVFVYSYNYFQN